MNKPILFNQKYEVSLDKAEIGMAVLGKVSDKVKKQLDQIGISFPEEYFKKILRHQNFQLLADGLFKSWKQYLPKEIHIDCQTQMDENCPDEKKNCFQSWLEFNLVYFLAGNHFANLIEANKKTLRKLTKERLAILFFQKAFVFENGKSGFQVGEMSKLVLKEGLNDISEQLKSLETRTALEVANNYLSKVRKDALLNDNGFSDVEEFQKEFWDIEKQDYETKLQLEEKSNISFLEIFVNGFKELQNQGENQECIKNTKNNVFHESPFRYYFKAILAPYFQSVEAEPEKGYGRLDLKISDNKLDFDIKIEFKGWWNKDKFNVTKQTIDYLTDFERKGYVFMVNHLKKKNIVNDYKKKIIESQTSYIENSWVVLKYKQTGFEYYISRHKINGKEKELVHFIFNALFN